MFRPTPSHDRFAPSAIRQPFRCLSLHASDLRRKVGLNFTQRGTRERQLEYGSSAKAFLQNERSVSGMKIATICGILLVIIGVVVLVYGGVTYTTKQTTMQVGPVAVNAKEKRTFPLSPLAGGVMVAAGSSC